ncbi:tRNA 5-methoxyuridine(34)/uridine 5-oxyacetic acid(34) synthase CmoB [Aliikangiella maris]|uniref:tRNA 5-methoxyuridine(34)/uridine 5-oxyacetic acid(34) synthase CmoB n=2 Tax=Aliikangiella maris TaxID=3162458 RepID=A0ABV2BPJ4_9GAMM
MLNLPAFFHDLNQTDLADWQPYFQQIIEQRLNQYTHGEWQEWEEIIEKLPLIKTENIELKDQVSIGSQKDLQQLSQLETDNFIQKLKRFHPWRKGPYNLFDIHINTEWRSDWKWDRVIKHISPLKNRTILDVGCGNGYHCWRMLGEKAQFVLGIDPSQKFLAQFAILKKYIGECPVHLLPLGIEDMPKDFTNNGFDTVFSMGVLYHRKSPINHLLELKQQLRPGGELVLETLVIDGDEQQVLVPTDRYAQMRNVWFIPSAKALELWLARSGFKNIRTVDINQTSLEEQRSTDWMHFHSLKEYLSPDDINQTIEGYPAPKRATLIATL